MPSGLLIQICRALQKLLELLLAGQERGGRSTRFGQFVGIRSHVVEVVLVRGGNRLGLGDDASGILVINDRDLGAGDRRTGAIRVLPRGCSKHGRSRC